MCRNIKKLRRSGSAQPSDAELHDAALQFIRKISGYRAPSKINEEAFEDAVHEVAHVAKRLFRSLKVKEPRRVAV